MKLQYDESNNMIVLGLIFVISIPVLFGLAWYIEETNVEEKYTITIDDNYYKLKKWSDGTTTIQQMDSWYDAPISNSKWIEYSKSVTTSYPDLESSASIDIDLKDIADSATITGIYCADGSVEKDIENMIWNGVYYEC